MIFYKDRRWNPGHSCDAMLVPLGADQWGNGLVILELRVRNTWKMARREAYECDTPADPA